MVSNKFCQKGNFFCEPSHFRSVRTCCRFPISAARRQIDGGYGCQIATSVWLRSAKPSAHSFRGQAGRAVLRRGMPVSSETSRDRRKAATSRSTPERERFLLVGCARAASAWLRSAKPATVRRTGETQLSYFVRVGPKFKQVPAKLRTALARIRTATTEIKGQRIEISALRTEISALRIKNKGLLHQIRTLPTKVRIAPHRIRTRRTKIKGSRTQISVLRFQITGLVNQIRTPPAKLRTLLNRIRTQRTKLRDCGPEFAYCEGNSALRAQVKSLSENSPAECAPSRAQRCPCRV